MKAPFRKTKPAGVVAAERVEPVARASEAAQDEPANAFASEPAPPAAPEPVKPVDPADMRKHARALEMIGLVQHAILDLSGAAEELRIAYANAMSLGIPLGEALRKRLNTLEERRQQLRDEQREMRAKRLADSSRAGPAIVAAIRERENLERTIAAAKRDIATFDARREDFKAKLADAGLSREEIAGIEAKPSYADLARWEGELAVAKARDATLAEMLRRGASAFLAAEGS